LWDDFILTKLNLGDNLEYLHLQEKRSGLLDFGTRRRLSLFDTNIFHKKAFYRNKNNQETQFNEGH
jgi:hypothetical protein